MSKTNQIKEALDNKINETLTNKTNPIPLTPTKVATCRAIYELVSVLEKLGEQLDYANQSSLIDLKAKEADWEEKKRKQGE